MYSAGEEFEKVINGDEEYFTCLANITIDEKEYLICDRDKEYMYWNEEFGEYDEVKDENQDFDGLEEMEDEEDSEDIIVDYDEDEEDLDEFLDEFLDE